MRVAIIDDEPAARAALGDVLDSVGGFEIVAEAGDGRTAIDTIERATPDIVFLDIDMPGLDGLSVARATRSLAYQLVFVTAHHQHALAAFETHAIDYLMKPVRPSALEKCVAKILRQRDLYAEAAPESDSGGGQLVLHDSGSQRVIAARHVLLIEGLGRYRRVHLSAEGAAVHGVATVISDVSLDAFGDRLDQGHFMRVHRSYLVNIDAVVSMLTRRRRYQLVVDGFDEPVPVARARVRQVKARLMR